MSDPREVVIARNPRTQTAILYSVWSFTKAGLVTYFATFASAFTESLVLNSATSSGLLLNMLTRASAERSFLSDIFHLFWFDETRLTRQ